MRTRTFRRFTAITALALTSLAAAAACSSAAAPARPLAAQTPPAATPTSTPTPSASPSTPVSPTTKPPPTTTHTTNPAPTCLGAVIYRVDASAMGRSRPTVCIAVGGVVRINQLGPDGLARSGSADVSCYYEGAVHFCRLVDTGTAKFTITRGNLTRHLTVVVAKASSPPKPSPACQGVVKYVFNADESGLREGALCLKVRSVLRLENLGPDGLSVTPASGVSCYYAAGVHECRLLKVGTVRFKVTIMGEHTLAVVVIK